MKPDELKTFLKATSQRIGSAWVASGFSDFSFYYDQDYLLECLWTHMVTSGGAIKGGIKETSKLIYVNPVKVLDHYCGVGLTSLEMSQAGWQVDGYNDVPAQNEANNRLHALYEVSPNIIEDETQIPVGAYDIVVCLEVLEHFKEPLSLAQSLTDYVKPEGFIIETTSFSSPQHPGHFPAYIIDGKEVAGRVAAREVHSVMKNAGFVQVFSGYNGRPRIWQRKKNINLTY
jgi:2-polyprenyl-3-methyl-5-hydroxy-6-metoxy-1,4-benzoquinol methylase